MIKRNKFAFIDVQNTETTARQILGFLVDWNKLLNFLKNDWKCKEVFFYTGIDAGDSETQKEFELLKENGGIIRSKLVFSYKNKNRELKIRCPKCNNEFIETIEMGYSRKSNCDVDLTVDAMEYADKNSEFYLFTGDGDFEFLINKAVEKGAIVHIVSSAKRIKSGPRYSISRFSTKLRKLTQESGRPVDFLDINNLKFKIRK